MSSAVATTKKWVLFFPYVIRDILVLLKDADIRLLASALAFTTLISLVPLLAVSLSVFHSFGGLEYLLKKVEPFLLQNLIPTSGADITSAIRGAIHRVHSGALGFWGVIGLMLASTKMCFDIERAVQKVWQLTPRKKFAGRLMVYWMVMFAVPVVIAVILGLAGSKDLGFYKHVPKWTISFVLLFVGLFTTYKYMPAVKVVKKWAALSALVAASAILFLQISYVGITRELISYNKVYGSLVSVPFFLIWLLVVWWIFLVGCGLCASLQSRAQR
jgi:membrane protein